MLILNPNHANSISVFAAFVNNKDIILFAPFGGKKEPRKDFEFIQSL